MKQVELLKESKIGLPVLAKDNPEKMKEYRRKWRINNAERDREYNRKWKEENKEKTRKHSALWKKLNPDKVKEMNKKRRSTLKYKTKARIRVKKWREDNPGKLKEWKKSNPEACRIYLHNYISRKKNNGGRLSKDIASMLFDRQKGKCSICKKDLKITGHQLDHIIPISRGGANKDKNIQLTCPTCNQKKHNKDPIEFMQEQGFLL